MTHITIYDYVLLPVYLFFFYFLVKRQSLKITDLGLRKIDVEGAEYDTLKGARATLQNLRPVCIVAIHPEPIKAKGDKLGDIYDLITECRYRIMLDKKELSKVELLANTGLIDLHIRPL